MAEPLEEFCGGAKFWDLEVVWNTTNPDLPECFQKTVLVWIPFGFLWAFTPLQAYYLRKSTKRTIPWTGLNIAKIALGAILSLLMLADVSHSVHLYNNDVDVPMVDFYSPFIKFCTFILITLLIYLEKQRGIQSTGVTFTFWFLVLIAACVSFRTHIEKLDEIEKTDNMFEFVVQMIYFALVPAEFLLHCFSDAAPKDKVRLEINKSSEKDTLPKTMCPEDNSSFFSRILFSWFDSMAVLGYKHPLEHKDLWVLNYVDSSRNIAAKFEADWKTEVLKYSRPNTNQSAKFSGNGVDVKFKSPTTKRQPSLLRVLWKSFGAYFLLGSFLKFINDLLVFANPMLLKLLIEFVSNPNEPLWRGYMYAALILVAALVQSVVVNQHFHIMFLTGMRVRSAVISSVYTKAMRMSNSAKRSSTVGEIVNLMSVDAQRFMDLTTYLNTVWSAPLQIIISLVLLWGSLGPSVLSGVVIMILLIPANGVIARINQQLQIKQMKNKDQRVKLMNEVLSGMKVLKLYAWEHSFEQQISAIRNKELKVLKTTAYLNAFTMFIWLCAPFLVMLATFTTYVLISEENILDASKAFVSLSLFDIMRLPMTLLPIMIVGIVQASVSMKRMNKFLNNDELDPLVVTHNPKDGCPLVIEDGTFSWGPDDDPVLQNINLEVVDGSIVAVVGPVGSGKSSLVAALLGEMEKLDGRVNTKGTIAYVAQQAWIQNASLKQNILFGNPFDGEKYSSIIEACALKPDFEMLPGGDDTEIGEKGINLSGGQKQRVSLARAVYNDSEVYFLDDPLSAVDSHVGKHIFDKVIGPDGLLKRKTRILVTHGITYLPQVDTIVVLNDGRISEVGSYQELLDKKGAFADFLMTYLIEQTDVDDLEDLDELKDELIEKLGPELERRLSRTLSRALSNTSQSSDKAMADGGDVRLGRQLSNDTAVSPQKQIDGTGDGKVGTKLVTDEASETGKVKRGVYIYYLSSIGMVMGILTILANIGSQSAAVGSNIWLSEWSNDKPTVNGTQDTQLRDLRLGIYGLLGFLQAVLLLIGSASMAYGMITASRLLHTQMLDNILHSPMSFFDTTPLGRIVNRFSKDVDVVDSALPTIMRSWLNCSLQLAATLIVISTSTPIFVAVIVPVGILYYFVQKFYVATSRQLKRLESVSRSPIYSHFSESINGAGTIRAYHRQLEFIRSSERKVDENQICYYPSIISNRWLAIRLEFVGSIIVFSAALFAVLGRDTMNPGLVGLSVSYALSGTVMLNWMVRTSSELETNIVAVERIKEYSETPQEAAWQIEEKKPPEAWPESGEIQFKNYSTRYRSGLDLILNGVSCSIERGEKIGIVGRTGAGKSSLTLALFRLIEPAGGTIVIDGVDVAKIGLHDLRKKLTIIPQDPVLFSGTLRINLDPFNVHSDEDLWKALEHSHLKAFAETLPAGLQHEVAEGGENLSVGQRQLVCLARALLRKTKILVLDEATAAVDLETDDLIQATISKEFHQCTVLVIAHRLNTIMDSNRVLVLDQGQIKEFDSPSQLLENRRSIFYGMAKDAGLV